ncbi:membrane protein insertion efficiency factor YidD [Rhodovibrio sodomensis]|uniref:Putative membrane protein insertion efficiency factor n=1 Tax=Rhodovibrio sodomensis TaxID=1088 RepID=A0ABS1DIU6_9PROT|nr:membrane protein insertion efficiency factor YidD [Rhodovibrio sodomensis]MBK1669911.1 membrane protein insertion efficiency factor YidD [Rhodovibrio sodomensis]
MASQQRPAQAGDRTADTAGARSRWPARLGRGAVIALIYVYQGVASVFPKVCRFEPSCSNYGLEAVRVHGALTGGWLTLKRILRCRPGGGFGVDPVPPPGCAHGHAGPDDPADRRAPG